MEGVKRLKKIDIRAKQFAKKYIDNNLDGTKTANEIYNCKNDNTAHSIATENLQKPAFQKAIIQVLEERGLKDEIICDTQLRNIQQSKNYSASNEAIKLYHQLKGNLIERKETKNLNITLTEEQLNEKINQLKEEIDGI
jgi:phage terminase small subunit